MGEKNLDTKDLQKRVIEFRDRRDWAKYHNPKDLAISLSLEAAALHPRHPFQWKTGFIRRSVISMPWPWITTRRPRRP